MSVDSQHAFLLLLGFTENTRKSYLSPVTAGTTILILEQSIYITIPMHCFFPLGEINMIPDNRRSSKLCSNDQKKMLYERPAYYQMEQGSIHSRDSGNKLVNPQLSTPSTHASQEAHWTLAGRQCKRKHLRASYSRVCVFRTTKLTVAHVLVLPRECHPCSFSFFSHLLLGEKRYLETTVPEL